MAELNLPPIMPVDVPPSPATPSPARKKRCHPTSDDDAMLIPKMKAQIGQAQTQKRLRHNTYIVYVDVDDGTMLVNNKPLQDLWGFGSL